MGLHVSWRVRIFWGTELIALPIWARTILRAMQNAKSMGFGVNAMHAQNRAKSCKIRAKLCKIRAKTKIHHFARNNQMNGSMSCVRVVLCA